LDKVILMTQINEFMPKIPEGKNSGSDTTIQLPGDCRPDCPICGGIGWIRFDRPIEDPLFGRMAICPNRSSDALGKDSGLDPRELGLKWSAIADLNNALAAVRAVKAALERGRGWVTLWGPTGLAKTLILQVAIAETIRAQRPARYARMVDIIDNLRQAFDTENTRGEETRRMESWAGLPILAIDETDRVRSSDYSDEKRFSLLDRRYQAALRGNSITLLASNSDPRGWGDYLASRVFDGRFAVVRMIGEDVRPMVEW
jgi:DNA replication protein DnaC